MISYQTAWCKTHYPAEFFTALLNSEINNASTKYIPLKAEIEKLGLTILKSDINVIALPALSDNYIWILASEKMKGIYVVDPGDSRPVLNWLNNKHLHLKGILITHHHPDHVGGVRDDGEDILGFS